MKPAPIDATRHSKTGATVVCVSNKGFTGGGEVNLEGEEPDAQTAITANAIDMASRVTRPKSIVGGMLNRMISSHYTGASGDG